ncbi:MAG: class I SAM-dependent methyltransferase [Betaproteobacteria bacterium]|nr:class I SAM-dependent methyltransferase [Betaproteobacteria bacterium]
MRAEKFLKYQQEAFSSVYSEPEEGNFHTTLIERVVAHYFDPLNLPRQSVILDLGCGQGKFLSEVRNRGYTALTGVTLSEDDFRATQAKGFNARMSDFSDLDDADASIDLIWCRHCLEHSIFPFVSLREFHRVLRPGGYAYIEVPAPDNDRLHEANPNHFSILGLSMWKCLFERAGFAILAADNFEFDLNLTGNTVREHYFIFVLRKPPAPAGCILV